MLQSKPRYIDATPVIEKFEKIVESSRGKMYALAYANALEELKALPVADVEKVVHCQACACSETEDCPPGKLWCRKMCLYMPGNGFCSCAERRDNNVR